MSDCNCGDMPPGGFWPKGEEPPHGCPVHGGARIDETEYAPGLGQPKCDCCGQPGRMEQVHAEDYRYD